MKSTEGYKYIFAKSIEIRYFLHSFTFLNHEAMKTADQILKDHEDANEMHFHQVDREWIIKAMEEYAASRQVRIRPQDQIPKDGEPVLITEMKFEDLIGKTIVSVKQKKLIGSDDGGFLEMQFSDGTKATIVAYYDGYEGEYPTGIFVAEKYYRDLEDVKQ